MSVLQSVTVSVLHECILFTEWYKDTSALIYQDWNNIAVIEVLQSVVVFLLSVD